MRSGIRAFVIFRYVSASALDVEGVSKHSKQLSDAEASLPKRSSSKQQLRGVVKFKESRRADANDGFEEFENPLIAEARAKKTCEEEQGKVLELNTAYAAHWSDPEPEWLIETKESVKTWQQCQTECTKDGECRYI